MWNQYKALQSRRVEFENKFVDMPWHGCWLVWHTYNQKRDYTRTILFDSMLVAVLRLRTKNRTTERMLRNTLSQLHHTTRHNIYPVTDCMYVHTCMYALSLDDLRWIDRLADWHEVTNWRSHLWTSIFSVPSLSLTVSTFIWSCLTTAISWSTSECVHRILTTDEYPQLLYNCITCAAKYMSSVNTVRFNLKLNGY